MSSREYPCLCLRYVCFVPTDVLRIVWLLLILIYFKKSPIIHSSLGSDLTLLVRHLPIRAFHLCLFKFGKFGIVISGGRAV